MEFAEITAKIKVGDIEVFELIAADIDWYHNNCKTPHTEKLLSVRDHLATLSYNLAFIAADFKSNYNSKYYIRKIETSKQKQGFINSGRSVAASETDSVVGAAHHLKAELEAEAASYKVDLLLKQVNKILEAMNQRIAFARAEEINQRNQNNIQH